MKILESLEGNKDLRKKKCEKEGKQEEEKNKTKEEVAEGEGAEKELLNEFENRKKLSRSPRKERIVQTERGNPVTT